MSEFVEFEPTERQRKIADAALVALRRFPDLDVVRFVVRSDLVPAPPPKDDKTRPAEMKAPVGTVTRARLGYGPMGVYGTVDAARISYEDESFLVGADPRGFLRGSFLREAN